MADYQNFIGKCNLKVGRYLRKYLGKHNCWFTIDFNKSIVLIVLLLTYATLPWRIFSWAMKEYVRQSCALKTWLTMSTCSHVIQINLTPQSIRMTTVIWFLRGPIVVWMIASDITGFLACELSANWAQHLQPNWSNIAAYRRSLDHV